MEKEYTSYIEEPEVEIVEIEVVVPPEPEKSAEEIWKEDLRKYLHYLSAKNDPLYITFIAPKNSVLRILGKFRSWAGEDSFAVGSVEPEVGPNNKCHVFSVNDVTEFRLVDNGGERPNSVIMHTFYTTYLRAKVH